MSKRNYLNVVSAGVVAFGTLALGLVTVLPVANAANAARTPNEKEQVSVDKYVKAVNEAKTKKDYDKALNTLRSYENLLGLNPAKVNAFKTVTLKDLKDAYDKAKASYDKVTDVDPKFEFNSSKLVQNAYNNAKAAYEAALKSPVLKEAIAKKAEGEGFKFLAKQIRKSNASADKLLALLNAAEKGKNLPETKLESFDVTGFDKVVAPAPAPKPAPASETPVEGTDNNPAVTPEGNAQKPTEKGSAKDTHKDQPKGKKGHRKFSAPNTGYEF